MAIIDLNDALTKDKISQGTVYINEVPQVRSGKKNDFMVGRFINRETSAEFRIWEAVIFRTVQQHGPGLYDVEVIGSEFNGPYLTVRSISPTSNPAVSKHDFLDQIPLLTLQLNWKQVMTELMACGSTRTCWQLAETILNDPQLAGRFFIEGAAIRHHDNVIGGLAHHTTKMLRLLAAVLQNNPELQAQADLLTLGVILHDVGKIFEYHDLEVAPYWYANHRLRAIEFLSSYRGQIIAAYDEEIYRQIQAIISGHHGDYGDRPTTVAAAIVHYLDLLESQTTGMLQELQQSSDNRIYDRDWGFLQGFPSPKQAND